MHLMAGVSVNGRGTELAERLIGDAAQLGLAVRRGSLGEVLVDAGSKALGSIAAGLRIAEISLGGLADVRLQLSHQFERWPWTIAVRSSLPVIACLGSQYAGWRLAHGQGKDGYSALGSGPARALARTEKLFEEIGYADRAERAVLLIESDRSPPGAVVSEIAAACRLKEDRLILVYAPTQSRVGSVQVVARVLEVALHKAHQLEFPLARIVEGLGAAPLPPPHPDFITAMGRTNDAIIFGGEVHLFVTGPAREAKALADHMPSKASRDYGRPFAEIFRRVDGDFYAIDPMLFSPASVIVTALDSGDSFRAGALDPKLLDDSFG